MLGKNKKTSGEARSVAREICPLPRSVASPHPRPATKVQAATRKVKRRPDGSGHLSSASRTHDFVQTLQIRSLRSWRYNAEFRPGWSPWLGSGIHKWDEHDIEREHTKCHEAIKPSHHLMCGSCSNEVRMASIGGGPGVQAWLGAWDMAPCMIQNQQLLVDRADRSKR